MIDEIKKQWNKQVVIRINTKAIIHYNIYILNSIKIEFDNFDVQIYG